MDHQIEESVRDYVGGGLMVALGVGAMALGTTYRVGSLSMIGPGFFPVVLGALLAATGVGIAVTAWLSRDPTARKTIRLDLRVWGLITASLVAFIVLGAHFGLLPAAFAVVFISALADRTNTVRSAALLACAVCVVAIVVFWWALGMQLPLVRWG